MQEIFERLESNVRGYCHVYPTVFDTASNAHQTDIQGRRYIDFFSGAGVLNYGHNNPCLKQALIDYLNADGVTHSLDMYSRSKAEFLERFERLILKPRGMDYKLQFTGPTGTNVVEAALKLARKVTGRSSVVAFTDGFHGMTLGALACTGNHYFRQAGGVALNDVQRAAFDGYLGPDVDTLEVLRRALKDPSSGMEPPAAFMVETIQAEGGVNVARAEWLQALQKLAHEVGSLLIVDDIQVGCGRTGRFFSFEDYDLKPDMICLAKALGGYGTPIGMLMLKPEIDQWQPGEHTGTFRGQNLSFVAGAAALGYFEDDELLTRVIDLGQQMHERLGALAAECNFELRGRGMIKGLDMGSGERVKAVLRQCFDNGLLVAACGPGGRVLKLTPPLTIEDDTLAEGLDTLTAALRAEVAHA